MSFFGQSGTDRSDLGYRITVGSFLDWLDSVRNIDLVPYEHRADLSIMRLSVPIEVES